MTIIAIDNPILIASDVGSRDFASYPPLNTLGRLTVLDAGDIAFIGQGPHGKQLLVGVEVKRIDDLVSSLDTGRLQGEQIPKIVSTYDIRWLLYYGLYRSNPINGNLQIARKISAKSHNVPYGIADTEYKGKIVWVDYLLGKRTVPYGYVESFLCSPSFTNLNIHSKRAIDIYEAIAWIAVLHRTWSKEYSKHRSMFVINTASDPDFDRQKEDDVSLMPTLTSDERECAALASKLPGLGYTRAVAATKHFPSVIAMMSAGIDEWCKVAGIGKTLAKACVEMVRRQTRRAGGSK